jgi:chitosanase
MWQDGDSAISYVYPPEGVPQVDKYLEAHSTGPKTGKKVTGAGFWEKDFKNALSPNSWHTVEVGVKMNTFTGNTPNPDGIGYICIDGKSRELKNVRWAGSPKYAYISELSLNTFFGGPKPSPKTQTAYYADFEMHAWNDGTPQTLPSPVPAPVKIPSPTPAQKPAPSPAPSPSKKVLKIEGQTPPGIPNAMLQIMGVDEEQMNNILAMIGGPEQSNIQWWNGVDRKTVFGYCENIGDGRGVTFGIAGFVTGFKNDFDSMLKEYGVKSIGNPDDCKPKSGKCSFCDWIRAHATDQKWIDVQLTHYAKRYMTLVSKYMPKQFKDNALIKGLLLDTAMNAGEFKEGNAWGVKEVSQAARGNTELEWVKSFCDIRYDHFTRGNSESMKKGRIGAWRKLAQDGKWDMRNVDLCKYAFCSGKCIGC